MGRITTPALRIEYAVANAAWTPGRWDTKHAGRPTNANLAKHVAFVEESTKPGGVNAHLGPSTIRAARVVRQATGKVVATWAR